MPDAILGPEVSVVKAVLASAFQGLTSTSMSVAYLEAEFQWSNLASSAMLMMRSARREEVNLVKGQRGTGQKSIPISRNRTYRKSEEVKVTAHTQNESNPVCLGYGEWGVSIAGLSCLKHQPWAQQTYMKRGHWIQGSEVTVTLAGTASMAWCRQGSYQGGYRMSTRQGHEYKNSWKKTHEDRKLEIVRMELWMS